MLIDGLKLLVVLLSGGAAGAFITQWFQRRSARVQTIPLIERVNRLVKPGLTGFILARRLGNGELEEVQNVREYQFTLRNTSSVHLHGAEIQFEFPAQDVEGQAERPALSNTPPVLLNAVAAPPWKKAFRWRIPQFPATDSMEVTFRAVDPESDEYEVALYNSGPVVVERSKRDTSARRRLPDASAAASFLAGLIVAVAIVSSVTGSIFSLTGEHKNLSTVAAGGCSLNVISSFDHLNPGALPWQGPWRIDYEISNQGAQPCKVASSLLPGRAATVSTDFETRFTTFSQKKPTVSSATLLVGIDDPAHPASVNVYLPSGQTR